MVLKAKGNVRKSKVDVCRFCEKVLAKKRQNYTFTCAKRCHKKYFNPMHHLVVVPYRLVRQVILL